MLKVYHGKVLPVNRTNGIFNGYHINAIMASDRSEINTRRVLTMKTRRTTRTPATPVVVEQGTGWTICWDRSTRDYSVYVELEYVGSRATQGEARSAANSYVYEQLKRAA
jgi:hypothetical protein